MAAEVCIVTFPTTHAALRAERAASRAGLEARMIPVPRGISSDCNMGMEAAIRDMGALQSLMAAEQIECDFVRWPKP